MTYTTDDAATHWAMEHYRWLERQAVQHAETNGGTYEDGQELFNDVLLAAWSQPRPHHPRRYLETAVKNRWLNVAKQRQREASDMAEAMERGWGPGEAVLWQ